jgi:uncharacterized RDD family membrane protein YckC
LVLRLSKVETMPESRQNKKSKFVLRFIQISLWVILAVVLVMSFWRGRSEWVPGHLLLAGDRTNLFAVICGKPADSTNEGSFAYRQMDAREHWSDSTTVTGVPAQVAAFQEDLAVMFGSGGLRSLGPADLPYQTPPTPTWQTVALAAADGTLMALGLDDQRKAVFAERGQAWGDVQPVDLAVKWPDDVGLTARGAVREGEFHVVWTEPLAESPIGGESPKKNRLHFAYRDTAGKWLGPFADPAINPAGPLNLAALRGKLFMVYRESAPPATADEVRLAWAEFTPADGKWHRVKEVELPKRPAEAAKKNGVADYGFTRFADRLVLALQYEDGTGKLFTFDPANGDLKPGQDIPEMTLGAAGPKEPLGTSAGMVLVLSGVFLLVLLAMRSLQQQTLRARMASGEISRDEAARMVAAEVEKLMYASVLAWRILACLLDFVIVMLVTFALLGLVGSLVTMPVLSLDQFLGQKLSEAQAVAIFYSLLANAVGYCVWFLYATFMEILWQRTLGKMACGLVVVDLNGARAAWWRVVLRNLLRPLDFFPFMLGLVGLLAIMWSPRNQRLGDMLGGTRVIMRPRTSGTRQDGDTRVV